MNTHDQIQLLYLTYFNRAADPAGLAYWQARLEAGESLAVLREAFANPEVLEVSTLYADADSPESYVTTVYQNLLNREPDPSGLAYWSERVQELVDQGASLESAGLAVLAAFMGAANGNVGIDADTLNAKLLIASTITEAAQENPELVIELSALHLSDDMLGRLSNEALAELQDTILGNQPEDKEGPGHSGTTPTQPPIEVSLEEVSLDALASTDLIPAPFDAGAGSFIFDDDIALRSHTRIENFGEDDLLRLIGVEADDVRVQVSGDNTQIQFDDGAGQLSQIELVGISGFFTSVEEFNQNAASGDIQFA